MIKKILKSKFFISLLFLEVIVRSQTAKQHDEGNTDFLHESTLMVENLVVGAEKTQNSQQEGNLLFQPNILDFLQRSIGCPHNQVVILFNKSKNRSVYLGSITGSSPDFYSSYFEDKVISPGSNTTFKVVFLPRRLGESRSSLLIHTSFGVINYSVRGVGIECPYRLRPLIGLKAPLNSTISPEINLYNPHDTSLQVVEVFSSGGNFQLELPSGGQEGDWKLWEIPPHSTKPIIRVRFIGKIPGNHTAYVRIKISGNPSSLVDNMLVVPIEIEIHNETGIYSKVPLLDFGIVGTNDGTTKYSFNLLNSGKSFVDIKSWGIEIDEQYSSLVAVDLQRLNNNDNNISALLHVEMNWSKFQIPTHINGSIFVTTEISRSEHSREESVYKIPFYGQLLSGGLEYNAENLNFLSSDKKIYENSRHFILKNKFNVPLSITNLTVPDLCSQHFQIIGFQPTVLQPDTSFKLLDILPVQKPNFTNNNSNNNSSSNQWRSSLQTFFKLMTNISNYEIPILSYNGILRRLVPLDTTTISQLSQQVDEKQLNFGTLPISKPSKIMLALINDNPIPITIVSWKESITSGTGSASSSGTLRGCGKLTLDNLVFCNKVKPGEWVVFEISVHSNVVGTFNGKFVVKTDFEEIVTPIKFSTAMGRLQLKQELLIFDNCFPGKICSLNLSAYSTFMKKMHVEGIAVDMDGISYEFTVNDNEEYPEILPNHVTDIGKLYFNPKQICKNNCYTSFDLLSKPFGVKWMSTVNNYSSYTSLDSEKLVSQLKNFIEVKQSLQSISFRLTTSQIRRHEFNASINFIWPRLLNANIEFPFVQINRLETKYIEIHNPSNQLLFIHFVLHDPKVYGSDINILPEALRDCPNCILSEENVFSFNTNSTDIYVSDIKPNGHIKIGINFLAPSPGTYSTILYMRNNLTVVEAVWVTARAVVPQFKFGNRRPGSQTSLMFEIGEKHLKLCDKSQPGSNVLITSKRSFTAKNYGEVPITISRINIENFPCEGYGFKVLNCAPLQLLPNDSKKIEIAFSPDFTLARVVRQLNFETSIGQPVNFTLLATVPPHALENCSKYIVRPTWESEFKHKAVIVLTIALLFVVMAAYFDADKVLKEHLKHLYRDKNCAQPPLDLRKIALESSGVTSTESTQSTAKTNNSSPNLTSSQPRKRNVGANGANNVSTTKKVVNGGMSLSGLSKKSWTDFKNRFTGTKPAITTQIVTESALKSPPKPPVVTMNNKSPQQEKREASGNKEKNKHSDEDSASNSSKENEIVRKSSVINTKTDTQTPLLTSNNINKTTAKSSGKKTNKNQLNIVDLQKTPNTSKIPCEKTTITSEKFKMKEPKVKSPNGTKINSEDVKNVSPTIGLEGVSFTSVGDISPTTEQCIKSDLLQKKYGKTPGRERKASNQNSNLNMNMKLNNGISNINMNSNINSQKSLPKINGNAMKPNLLQFPQSQFGKMNNNSIMLNNNLTNNAQPLASIWTASRASFSDVVAQSPTEVKPVKKPYYGHNNIGVLNHSNSTGNVRRNLMQDQEMKKFSGFGYDNDMRAGNNNLGPIGTKKSPSQTPIWEPLQPNMQRPTPIAPPPASDSYFGQGYQDFGFNNNFLATGPSRNQFENFEALLRLYAPTLTQQQINDEIFTYAMRLEEERKLQNGWGSSVPTSSSSYWSPAYHPTNNNLQNQTNNNNYGVLRPPPGLHVNNPTQAMLQQLQQQQQQQQSQQLQQQPPTPQLNIPPPGFPQVAPKEPPMMQNSIDTMDTNNAQQQNNFGSTDPIWSFVMWEPTGNNSGNSWTSNSSQQQQQQ